MTKQIMDAKLIGQRLRQAREKIGLSQGELGAIVNHSQRDISEYETGKRLIRITELPLFSETLNVPSNYFFTGEFAETSYDKLITELSSQITDPRDKEDLVNIVRIFCEALSRK